MADRPQGREQRKPKPKRKLEQHDVSDMLDVHLRFGLEDQFVRLPKAQWKEFVDRWVVDGEDVVLRAVYGRHETNHVLRGTYHATYSVRAADPSKHIPVFEVVVCSDVRQRRLAEQEL